MEASEIFDAFDILACFKRHAIKSGRWKDKRSQLVLRIDSKMLSF